MLDIRVLIASSICCAQVVRAMPRMLEGAIRGSQTAVISTAGASLVRRRWPSLPQTVLHAAKSSLSTFSAGMGVNVAWSAAKAAAFKIAPGLEAAVKSYGVGVLAEHGVEVLEKLNGAR